MKTIIAIAAALTASSVLAHQPESTVTPLAQYINDQCVQKSAQIDLVEAQKQARNRGYVLSLDETRLVMYMGCVAVTMQSISKEYLDGKFGEAL